MKLSLTAATADDTAELARRMSLIVRTGDVLLLSGEIGAGKTHFARSLILALLDEPEDVPSPTFTLVQTYNSRIGEIWHTDLYRLTGPDEAVELGLDLAFETALCLIEWPDRLEDLTPAGALSMTFTAGPDDTRRIVFSSDSPEWEARLAELAQ